MEARPACLLVALAAIALAATPPQQITQDEFRSRRAALRKSLPDGVAVLFGRNRGAMENAGQEPNFYYLTGWEEPGAILLLKSDGEILFLPRRNPVTERYEGKLGAPNDPDIQKTTGFDTVLPVEGFEAQFAKALEAQARIYTLPAETNASKLKDLAPLREMSSAEPAIARLRMKKSEREVAAIQRATDVTVEAFFTAWKRIVPGMVEYQAAAAMVGNYMDKGCGSAYPPILGSGPNALVLHYQKNDRRMDAGEVMVMDVGAECGGYASDVTRTVPVSGKFSPRQRQIYDLVLGAQQAVIAAIKPGVTMGNNRNAPNSLYKAAYDYFESHGTDLKGSPLGKYLLHGVSHSVGLEVHDASPASYTQPLEAGMVITAEPGLYIPEEGIGIRIEDTVLVTEKGARVLSSALPKEAAEVEKAMAAR